MANFIERCLDLRVDADGYRIDDVRSDDIDDFVKEWHESKSELSIHEFLGMTEDEYKLWVEQPEILEAILTARQKKLYLCAKNHVWLREKSPRAWHYNVELLERKEDWEYGQMYSTYKCRVCGHVFVEDDCATSGR